MYNMQAVVRKSINNATMQFEKLGYVANNLANYNTAAYKTNRFEQILRCYQNKCTAGFYSNQ